MESNDKFDNVFYLGFGAIIFMVGFYVGTNFDIKETPKQEAYDLVIDMTKGKKK